MVFVDSGKGVEGEYLYLKEVNDNDVVLLNHLGFEPLDCNNGAVVDEPDLETWVKYEDQTSAINVTLRQFCEMALSNENICITDNAINGGILKQKPAYKFLMENDSELDMLVDRFTSGHQTGDHRIYLFVSLKIA
jgi:hypothetical protein